MFEAIRHVYIYLYLSYSLRAFNTLHFNFWIELLAKNDVDLLTSSGLTFGHNRKRFDQQFLSNSASRDTERQRHRWKDSFFGGGGGCNTTYDICWSVTYLANNEKILSTYWAFVKDFSQCLTNVRLIAVTESTVNQPVSTRNCCFNCMLQFIRLRLYIQQALGWVLHQLKSFFKNLPSRKINQILRLHNYCQYHTSQPTSCNH